ncbi:MAG: hydrolase 1, exosortase A system-associated [Azoarcus sp.]|nr:MAG: hydrolase 1, exosortase A system-associated [Azoarcus sp.]
MTVREAAFLFECEGDELVGIIAAPEEISSDLGVLVVVGGPQYRVGSHRQFVLMARRLAANGFACMRFDYRGMGDATGEQRDFEHVEQDIRAAIDAFCARAPAVKRVVLWGLCDGASAACFYAAGDMRVTGMVLLNPWVKTAAGEAKTYLKHYYLQRVLEPAFWKKLMGGGV